MSTFSIKTAAKGMVALPLAIAALQSEGGGDNTGIAKGKNFRDSLVANIPAYMLKATVATGSSITFQLEDKPLSNLEENRFHKLAIKEAIGTITDAQRVEMEALDARRTIDKPLPTDAIIARERLFSKIDALLEKLDHLTPRNGSNAQS